MLTDILMVRDGLRTGNRTPVGRVILGTFRIERNILPLVPTARYQYQH